MTVLLPGCSIKRLGALLHLDGMLVHRKQPPQLLLVPILYTPGSSSEAFSDSRSEVRHSATLLPTFVIQCRSTLAGPELEKVVAGSSL
jgi:hypothetical protein